MSASNPLISATELKERLTTSDQQMMVLDASMHLPNANRDAWQEYQEGHIPGAGFFDIDQIADEENELPHMLPSAEDFSTSVANLGIGSSTAVVVYDSVGLFSAARVWWMFTVFGHTDVQVLDGGLPAWQASGGSMERGISNVEPAKNPIQAKLHQDSVASLEHVRRAVSDGCDEIKILDARSKARFDGAAPEPREGLRSGHMPGAYSLPFTELLTAGKDGVMRIKSADELRAIFAARGLGSNDAIITSCGSGVTAAVITLCLHIAGYKPGRLYDGSWVEWGGHSDTPIA